MAVHSDIEIVEAQITDLDVIDKINQDGVLKTYVGKQWFGVQDFKANFDPASQRERIQGLFALGFSLISKTWIAKMGGESVGYAMAWQDDSTAWLEGLYRLSSAKGNGVGKLLLLKVLSWVSSTKDLYLQVVPETYAADWYLDPEFGFQPVTQKVSHPTPCEI